MAISKNKHEWTLSPFIICSNNFSIRHAHYLMATTTIKTFANDKIIARISRLAHFLYHSIMIIRKSLRQLLSADGRQKL